MTSQTPEELDDQLLDDMTGALPSVADAEDVMTAIAPALAEIRRHAAAQALRDAAKTLHKATEIYLTQSQYEAATASGNATRLLLNTAQATIEEGWTETCAQTVPATREDPAEGCETAVENEGDYCPRHEPADDDRDDR